VNGFYLRPLLAITRQTTEAFCRDSVLEPWHDPHNQDPSFARVRVRNEVMPVLERELGPGVAEALARTAEQLREDADELDRQAQAAFDAVAKVQPTALELPVEALAAASAAIATRVIKLALEKFALGHERVHVLAVYQLVLDWHGQKPLTLRGVRVERKGQSIRLTSTKPMRPGAC
jgi:tRNA(Ile)-lysidine synthase